MSQQISVEDALEAFRKRHGELADENVLLRASISGLERQLSAALEENQLLRQAAGEQPASSEPGMDSAAG
jgi:regulator of replication initiation timing